MDNRETPAPEEAGGAEKKEKYGGFHITFPDGSIARFRSAEEAAEALREWRGAA